MKSGANILIAVITFFFIYGAMICFSRQINEAFQNYIEDPATQENIEHPENRDPSCPDVLIGTDNGVLLLNTSQPRSERNPIRFANLDEYIRHVETQKKQGKNCPILYLQQENNAQGQDVYRMRPSPFSMEGGLPPVRAKPVAVLDATRDHGEYNQNMFAGFDSHGQDVGIYNELDAIHESTQQQPLSDNPMDTNWGGVTYSQNAVLSGKYADRVVGKPTMVPKVLS